MAGKTTLLPFDCISQEWINLRYFSLDLFILLKYVDPMFWKLDNLESVIISFATNLNTTVLSNDIFDGYSDSLSYVSLYGAIQICEPGTTVDINGVIYDGFDYLNKNGYSYDDGTMNNKLADFVETFDPCHQPCITTTHVC